jgi:YD repeat-containing protein
MPVRDFSPGIDAGQPVSAGVRGRIATQYGYDSFGRLNSMALERKASLFSTTRLRGERL